MYKSNDSSKKKISGIDRWNTRTMAMKRGRFQASRTKEFTNRVRGYTELTKPLK